MALGSADNYDDLGLVQPKLAWEQGPGEKIWEMELDNLENFFTKPQFPGYNM